MTAEDPELDALLARVREEPPAGLLERILATSEDPQLDAALSRVREEPPAGLLERLLPATEQDDPELDAMLTRVAEEPPAGLLERLLPATEQDDPELDAMLTRVAEEPPAGLLERLLPATEQDDPEEGPPPIDFAAEVAAVARALLKPSIVALAASLLVSVALSFSGQSDAEPEPVSAQLAYSSATHDLDAGAWLLGVSEGK